MAEGAEVPEVAGFIGAAVSYLNNVVTNECHVRW